MNKTASIIITTALVLGIGIIFWGGSEKNIEMFGSARSVEIRDGVQYITVNAKGGYYPNVIEIKGGLPTKLVVKTSGTYDCSASLVVRPIGFQKILNATGEEVIDLGIPKSGDKVQGICGMGMYSFSISTI